MNWEAIGAVGELVGAAGIIVTLLYLSFQVRQNSKLSMAATRTALADGAQRLGMNITDYRLLEEEF